MSEKTKISWADSTWSPIRARNLFTGRIGPHCERISPGCVNCYSESNNRRCLPFNGTGLPFNRQARDQVEIFVDKRILAQPLHWRAPRKIFVCSQTDLFGEWVPDEMIDQIFAVMARAQQHTFQVLTKRANRVRQYLSDTFMHGLGLGHDVILRIADRLDIAPIDLRRNWPLRNVWLGVSVEDRARKDRIDLLRQTPAAVRFVSFEPLLEDLGELDLHGIDLAIWGGESGSKARPCGIAWIRSGMKQAERDGCRNFVKQVGKRPIDMAFPVDAPNSGGWRCAGHWQNTELGTRGPMLYDPAGADPDEWPADLRVRELPEGWRV